ncbi:WD40 repeat-like protein [Durotheca rogersii]|uniref:WD40 repeat-like protein n=1 Tax=Durotheca rogersii TaxID=419775 RepID=UPI00221FF820|nr:WD40 repeat-like protein [Durotheca rogersii]KAI5860489.1 WD40 repeat-like protein [Durotheca rogersii]
MSTSPPVTEGARPRQEDPEPPRDLARSPTSSEDPGTSTSILASGRRSLTKLSRKDTAGREAKDRKDAESGAKTASSQMTNSPAIDPLSHHIFVRTNTDRTLTARFRTSGRPDSPGNDALPRLSSDHPVWQSVPQIDPSKEKKKGGSFLSRLSIIGGKKKDGRIQDSESEISELRTEGANAVAFSSTIGAGGYIPHHKEPPRYIRVRAQNKKVKEFDRMFLAQELAGTRNPFQDDQAKAADGAEGYQGSDKDEPKLGGPIWAVEFSKDGKYLATGGRDRVVRIWAVIATQEDREAYEEEENAANGKEERLSAPIFRKKPVREFTGHVGEILDLSWSKNNFLLSSSMDKTVRLWHISRQECLCTFKHKDFVTSIAFHPRDDRFFLAGSLDFFLRLWSIPDKAVAYSSQLSDFITAVGFSPDGRTAIAGCLNGFCVFYETEGLKYQTQIHVRSSRGKNAKGSKITGIETMKFPPDAPDGSVKVLITSNDSRIRIYDLGDKNLELKLKGHENACSQIRATFSDDGSYILCGSEDKRAFIWSTSARLSENREKRPCEYFEAHSDIVTGAIFAPTATRQLLQSSGDPIFTLCNPPPVTLLSKEEESATQTLESQDVQPEISGNIKKPDESPGFIARSTHYDGNIIVTADHSGLIKVFRQDCAFTKRRHDTWETGSTFSKKIGRDGLLGRTGSVITRLSASSRDPHSRRSSLTQPPTGIFQDRINTWRHGVEGGHHHHHNASGGRPVSLIFSTPTRSERSLSPGKASRGTPANAPTSNPTTNPGGGRPYASPTLSVQTNRTGPSTTTTTTTTLPPTPSFSLRPLDNEADHDSHGGGGGERRPERLSGYSLRGLNRWRNVGQLRGGGPGDGSSGGSTVLPISYSNGGHTDDSAKSDRRKSMGVEADTAAAASKGGAAQEKKADRRRSVPASVLLQQQQHHQHHQNHQHQASPRPSTPDQGVEGRGQGQGRLAPSLLPPHPTPALDPPSARLLSTPSSARPGAVVVGRRSKEVSRGEEEDGEDMRCSACGSRDFRAKKVPGRQRQRLHCGRCGRLVGVEA